MRVSGEEFLRVSQLRPGRGVATAVGNLAVAPSRPFTGADVDAADLSAARRIAEDLDASDADVREDVVASLRARIESGGYQVSGEQIAEMMVRRLLADRIR